MIKRRNMLVQVLLIFVTFGMYHLYWYYVTSKEMSEALKRNDEVSLWTVLMILPFANIYALYKQGELYEILSDKAVDRWVILLLWLFFPPAVWYIIQRKLNDLADGKAQLPPPSQAPAPAC